MDQAQWQQIKSILNDALDLPAAERDAWLTQRCGDDSELKHSVMGFLEQEERTALAIDKPALQLGSEARQCIGPYHIERELGEGGMGSVYLAVREDDECQTKVALKILKRGMDTDDFIKRFRNERDILANLEHPHIAQLREGGSTEDGLPYFVMEYVEGEPIDTWCNSQKLTVSQRLELFIKVCDAVHFAHRNLIVHRDLKPSNILVTKDGVPKLLDFGIAKLLQKEFNATKTATHLRVMTPGYAAPEQVRGQVLTTACDIYALGVMLYELLSGRRPYTVSNTSPAEMERIICDTTPGKPSTAVLRVSEDETVSDQGAVNRRTEPKRLSRLLRGDLDNIVLLALRKEPERRYDTAQLFAEDLRRFLDGYPVRAHKESWSYSLGKFIKRNRTGVTAAVLVALTLTVALGWIARKNRQVVVEQHRSQKISGLVLELFNALDPYSASQDTREELLLERIQAKVREEFAEDTRDKAQFLETIGKVYLRRGKLETSKPLLDEALALRLKLDGPKAEVTAATQFLLGEWNDRVERFDNANALYTKVYETRSQLLGEAHPETAVARIRLAVSSIYSVSNKDAVKDLQAGVDILEQHPDFRAELANGIKYLGFVVGIHEPELGEQHMQRARKMMLEIYGRDHGEYADILATLGDQYRRTQKLEEGEAILLEAIDIMERVLGEEHPSLWDPMISLGYVYTYSGRAHDAVAVLDRALNLKRNSYSKDDRVLVSGMFALASAHIDAEMYTLANQRIDRLIRLARERFGPNSATELNATTLRGFSNMFLGNYQEAEADLDQVMDLTRGDDRHLTGYLEAGANQAVNLVIAGKWQRVPDLVAELDAAVEKPGVKYTYWQFQYLCAKARLAEREGDLAKAEAVFEQMCSGIRTYIGEHLYLAWAHAEFAALHYRSGNFDKALANVDTALKIREKFPRSSNAAAAEALKEKIEQARANTPTKSKP